MALTFYDKYLEHCAETPNETYNNLFQAAINDQWDNTTQRKKALEQNNIGSKEYTPIDVRVDYSIDMGTGFKQSDDFKVFAFRDLQHKTTKGLMYKYHDNDWITVNTSEIGSVSNDIVVRRCNNTMRWIDRSNGYINELPCVIEYVLKSPQQLKDKDVVVANGHATIICQGNELTRNLEKNTRFIFNGEPYKFLAYQHHLGDDGIESNLLYLELYLDMIEPDDDTENNLANAKSYNYGINIETTVTEQLNGYNGQVYGSVSLNGETASNNIIYKGNNFVQIDNSGAFTLIGENGDTAKITAWIEGNEQISTYIEIQIVDSLATYKDILISPIYTDVRIGDSVSFNVNLYIDGVLTEEDVIVTTSGAETDCYLLEQDKTHFTLSCIKFSPVPLKLSFTSSDIVKDIEIKLKSLF